MSRLLPCEGYRTWTDCGYEYDCGYGTDIECCDCVCTGGNYDPKYNYDKQPRKLSKFVLKTRAAALIARDANLKQQSVKSGELCPPKRRDNLCSTGRNVLSWLW